MTPLTNPHVFRHEAMATWFEVRVPASADAAYSRQASEEAFRLLDHLESLLSRFRENSDVTAIRSLHPDEALTVHADTFECLTLALQMAQLTGGAFDPALGAVMDRWRDGPDSPPPAADAAAEPRAGVLVLDPIAQTVRCQTAPVALDLGAIGKGYALDRMGALLDEWEVGPALLVGGGSSLLATGHPEDGWDVGLTSTTRIRLTRGSIGCSGLSVKGSHILNPQTGLPAETPARAWALSAQAAVSDALSTAFMVLPLNEVEAVCQERPEAGAVVQLLDTSPDVRRIGRALGVNYGFIRTSDSQAKE